MPSGSRVPFDLSEIEKPLRRTQGSDELRSWTLIILMLITATVAYYVVADVVDEHVEASQVATQSIESSWDNFCAQAMEDHAATGTAASQDLQELCN